MSKQEWNSISEKSFEKLLQNNIKNLPPDDVVEGVTPWRKAMNSILIGLAMNAIKLNFLCLDYILPTVGMIMVLVGFRTLRKENAWFMACYILVNIRMAYYLPTLIINATIYQSTIYELRLFDVMTYLNLAVMFSLLFCLWEAIKAVKYKIGLPAHAGGVAAMIAWYALICLLAAVEISSGFIVIIIMIAYIFIIKSLLKTSRELDEAGYAITTSKVKVSDWVIVTCVLLFLSIGIASAYMFFNKYPMDWSMLEASEHQEVEEIKTHLDELGFPEAILDDLTVEDIKACDGALHVVVETKDCHIDDLYEIGAQDEEDMRVTGVAVKLPGERERWKIFHHFLFVGETSFYGTEAIQLWTIYNHGQDWKQESDITGRVLFTKEGNDYVAQYHSLGTETNTYTSEFFGDRISTDVFATFSMPKDGEKHRGYASYIISANNDDSMIVAWINYVHQKSWLQYPVITAKENHIASFGDNFSFELIQGDLQFDPQEVE